MAEFSVEFGVESPVIKEKCFNNCSATDDEKTETEYGRT